MSERNLGPRSRSDTVRRVLALFSERRASLAAAAALTVAVVVGTLTLPVLSGRAVDCVVGVGRVDFAGLYRALAWIALTLGATALCQWALTAVTNRLAFGAALTLRGRAFDHLQELPLSYIDSHGHGDLAARIVTDADMLTNGLLMAFQQLPVGVLTIVVSEETGVISVACDGRLERYYDAEMLTDVIQQTYGLKANQSGRKRKFRARRKTDGGEE